jgi:hypothetical protein
MIAVARILALLWISASAVVIDVNYVSIPQTIPVAQLVVQNYVAAPLTQVHVEAAVCSANGEPVAVRNSLYFMVVAGSVWDEWTRATSRTPSMAMHVCYLPAAVVCVKQFGLMNYQCMQKHQITCICFRLCSASN